MLWGTWGGRHPGGWCHVGSHAGCSGTQEECARTAAALREENPSLHYEVVPFDSDREPPARSDKPTRAQVKCLLFIARTGQLWGPRQTNNAVMDRGWAMNTGGQMRLTKAGKEAAAK